MRPSVPLTLALGLAASACAVKGDHTRLAGGLTGRADAHKISVEPASQRLELPVTTGAASAEDEARVESFARAYREFGHGTLLLSVPSGGAEEAAATHLAQAVRRRLAEGGVPFSAIVSASYEAQPAGETKSDPKPAPLVLTFTRYTAAAPACAPAYLFDYADGSPKDAPKNFGCAVSANLAAMIADPADLLKPRPSEPRDGDRRQAVLDRYRAGAQTHATRTEDERATVSDVAK